MASMRRVAAATGARRPGHAHSETREMREKYLTCMTFPHSSGHEPNDMYERRAPCVARNAANGREIGSEQRTERRRRSGKKRADPAKRISGEEGPASLTRYCERTAGRTGAQDRLLEPASTWDFSSEPKTGRILFAPLFTAQAESLDGLRIGCERIGACSTRNRGPISYHRPLRAPHRARRLLRQSDGAPFPSRVALPYGQAEKHGKPLIF